MHLICVSKACALHSLGVALPLAYLAMMGSRWFQSVASTTVPLSFQKSFSVVNGRLRLPLSWYKARIGEDSSCISDPDAYDQGVEEQLLLTGQISRIDARK